MLLPWVKVYFAKIRLPDLANWGDPIQLAWMVSEVGWLVEPISGDLLDPIHLACMVNQVDWLEENGVGSYHATYPESLHP